MNELYAEIDRLKRERDALAKCLERILSAHETGNNGAVMGEAVLCRYFASMAKDALAQVRK